MFEYFLNQSYGLIQLIIFNSILFILSKKANNLYLSILILFTYLIQIIDFINATESDISNSVYIFTTVFFLLALPDIEDY